VLADDGDVQLADARQQAFVSWRALHGCVLQPSFPCLHHTLLLLLLLLLPTPIPPACLTSLTELLACLLACLLAAGHCWRLSLQSTTTQARALWQSTRATLTWRCWSCRAESALLGTCLLQQTGAAQALRGGV
jgi:hypothetical protein